MKRGSAHDKPSVPVAGSPRSDPDDDTWDAERSDSLTGLLREVAAAPPVAPRSRAPLALMPGDRIGDSFVVEELLGTGGMGVVYRAHDIDLDRAVAIKLRRGPTNAADMARLVREAKVMAQLSDPHVVTVFEVGTHRGCVFIAMEYVEPGSLRTWLRPHGRDWRAVVHVYAQAALGLAAAHAIGIVHRDFKPDNVLVDRHGRARVADFGLARWLDAGEPSTGHDSPAPDVALPSLLTPDGTLVGTPGYMAPEQFMGGEVGPAADQFAFCVSLYESLYGQRPFGADHFGALLGAISAQRITPPLTEASVPAWLRRVVLRGLRADPEQRHPSMLALRAALVRDAGPRRERWLGVGALATAVVAGAWWWAQGVAEPPCTGAEAQMLEVWSPDRRAEVERAFAAVGVHHGATAGAAAAGVLDRYAEDWVAMHREACEATRIHATQDEATMDRRMACLAQRRGALEGLVRVLQVADRGVVDEAWSLTSGLPAIARCGEGEHLRQRVPEDPATAARVAELGVRLAQFDALAQARRPRDAAGIEDLYAEAEATGYQPLVVETLYVRARLAEAAGDLEAAQRDFERALWPAVELELDELAARLATRLAFIVGHHRNDADEGLRLLRLAEASARGDVPPAVRGNIESVRGSILRSIGDREGATRAYGACLEIEQAAYGPEHPRVASVLGHLAILLDEQERFDEADAAYVRAIRATEASLGSQHADLAWLLSAYAVHHAMRGSPRQAIPLLERSIAIREATAGSDVPVLVDSLQNLAKTYLAIDEVEPAKAALERALAIQERSGIQNERTHARLLETLAHVTIRTRRFDVALEHFEAAARVLEATAGPDDPDLAAMLANAGRCLVELGRHDEGRARIDRALEIRARHNGPQSEAAAILLGLIADVEEDRGAPQVALEFSDRALAILERLGRADAPTHASIWTRRGLVHGQLEHWPQAAQDHAQALRLHESGGAPAATIARARFRLGDARWHEGRNAEAVALARQARAELPEDADPEFVARIDEWLRDHP